eukprot:Skav225112  [mRNA]  locus=scaffold6354:53656:59446:+ [translate_table: standard]
MPREDDDVRRVMTQENICVIDGRAESVEKVDAGGIPVDAKLRSNVKHIFAAAWRAKVGDCIGGLQFTHLAGYQGALAAFNAVQAVKLAAPKVPRCTFTHPEVATVGLSLHEAQQQLGAQVAAKYRQLHHVDRAICEGETDGFIKVTGMQWRSKVAPNWSQFSFRRHFFLVGGF